MLAENHIPGCPAVPQSDIDEAFVGMKDYIFFKKNELIKEMKDYRCTACGEEYSICLPARTYTTEELELYRTKHKEYCRCARCGKNLEIINTGIKKKLSDLKDTKAVAIVIPVSENDVWIRCEFFYKHFANFPPTHTSDSYEAYHFVKGEEPEYYRNRYWYGDFARYTLREPFYMNRTFGPNIVWNYSFIGLDRLEDTFFKYSLFQDSRYYGENNDFEYLALYSKYPAVTEMLLKNGYSDLIRCKKRGIGVKRIIKFEAKSFKELFKLSKDELKRWAEYKNDVEICKTYMSLFRDRDDGFSLAHFWNNLVSAYNTAEAKKVCKICGITALELVRYLKKRSKSFYYWRDYIENAQKLHYDLSVHNVLFPKNLKQAHDEAIATVKLEADREAEEKAKKRFAELETLYGMQSNLYLIRPPVGAEEIIAEGKALQHCVGGYASRHANGSTTILFMRSVSNPDKPLYTIEMHGTTLRQVHGYNNTKSPYDVPEAKEFFESWLSWVKDGSKKKRKKKAENADIGVAV